MANPAELEHRPLGTAAARQVTAMLAQARADIERAVDVHDGVAVAKRANAIKLLAAESSAKAEVQNEAAELVLRARRKAGQLLAAVPRDRGAAGRPKGSSYPPDTNLTEYQQVLADAGLERMQANRWQQLAVIPDTEFERQAAAVRAGEDSKTLAVALRVAKETGRQAQRDYNQGLVDGTIVLSRYHSECLFIPLAIVDTALARATCIPTMDL